MEKLISVIIPVYNVSKYLSECLESVISQTYKNLEIIIVDDGSTDNSGEICDMYAQKDKRIKVIHQKNGGAGAAKNSGLRVATGDYISLIDSDDYIDKNMYKTLVETLEKNNTDAVQCMFCGSFTNGKKTARLKAPNDFDKIYNGEEYLQKLLYDWKYAIFWNKLFKAQLVKDVFFHEGRAIDDEFFTYIVMSKAERIINIDAPLYYYRIRKNSVMNDTKKDRLVSDRLVYLEERYNYVCKSFPKLKKTYLYYYSDMLLVLEKQLKNTSPVYSDVCKAIEKYPYHKPSLLDKIKEKNIYKSLQSDYVEENNDEKLIPFS